MYDDMKQSVANYLGAVRSFLRKQNDYCDKIAKLQARLEGVGAIRYDKDLVQGGKYDDRLAEGVEELERLKREFEEMSKREAGLYLQAQHICNTDNSRIVWNKEVQGWSWTKIARDAGLSQAWVRLLYVRGVAEIYVALPTEWK